VKPGQEVRAGDPLIELDKTAALAEKERARSDLTAALLDQMRLNAFLDGSTSAPFDTIAEASPARRQRAMTQLTAQIASQNSHIASLAKEKFQRVAERQVLLQTVAKLEKTLPLIAQRADIRAKAAERGNAPIPAKLESQQLLIEAQSEREITRSKITSVDAAIEEIDEKMLAADAEVRTTALAELSKTQDHLRAAEEALAKATRRADLQTLRAPISGTVQQMHIAGIGAVVTPAQQMLSVVPEDETVEVEAVLENRDIGFVTAGQLVELKVDAFPFTRYGLLAGTVRSIDRDAEATPVNASGAHGSERAADEIDHVEASERLRYTVHIALKPGTLDIDGRPAKLLPGMSVRAEILTGKRRIIDFILAPLNEHLHDAMRER
jgi:HlyD family secretion protein/hemolysin D